MKNDSDALRFSPQVMALAMPQESGFSKAAEGIGNVGKMFIDTENQKQVDALNTLKLQGAQEDLVSKQNENSVFNENQGQKRSTFRDTQRKNLAEAIGAENKNAADLKKQTENGFMDQYKQMIPSTTFNDPKTGKFSEGYYQTIRKGFEDNGGWTKDNLHLFDALADGYRKEAIESEKTKSEIGYKGALTDGVILENSNKPQEFKDKHNYSVSATQKNIIGAAKDKVEMSTIPIKIQQTADQIAVSKTNATTGQNKENRMAKKQVYDALKDPSFGDDIPGFKNLSPDDQNTFRKHFRDTQGQYLPITVNEHFYGNSATLGSTQSKPVATAPVQPAKVESATDILNRIKGKK
ncbi:hypothetical protein [Sulfuricurvum sp.]|uniref:hypothetical protein n=1 Tax=Sulfuricurvum sp. TaxID=2025608 RepID=UPI002630C92D|nr:hypothetical protein [Sulfuricurvum sp.]MDD2267454.1 hypothetical protein [Sulfuricurvum sp.]MDD2782824.1 hypothetical protein [Sulfuricurvum sp.]